MPPSSSSSASEEKQPPMAMASPGRSPRLTPESLIDPYACSMSTDVDLTLRDDLRAIVQDYLSRVVEELQLISQWTKTCRSQMMDLAVDYHSRQGHSSRSDDARPSTQVLLCQTEIEILRREMQVSQQELFQRCATQVAYVQNSVRSEQEDQMNELQRRLEEKLRFFTQKTIGFVEDAQSESEMRAKTTESKLRELQNQLDVNQAKVVEIETTFTMAVQSFSERLTTQQSDLGTLSRRQEKTEASLSQQLQDLRSFADESIQGLRSVHSQLSSKLQVVRLELQENSEDLNRKLLQTNKFLTRFANTTSATNATATVIPVSPVKAHNPFLPTMNKTTTELPGPTGSVRMATGASAMTTPDCFVYAKAVLPHRDALPPDTMKKSQPASVPPSTTATRDHSAHVAATAKEPSIARRRSDLGAIPDMESLLSIQPSAFSRLVGFEDEASSPNPSISVTLTLPTATTVPSTEALASFDAARDFSVKESLMRPSTSPVRPPKALSSPHKPRQAMTSVQAPSTALQMQSPRSRTAIPSSVRSDFTNR